MLCGGCTSRAAAARQLKLQQYWDFLDGKSDFNPFAETEKEEKQPGKIDKFFISIGDFFLLVWNIVRVNKWKICPIVKID